MIPVSPDHTDCENVGIHLEASSTGPDQKHSLSIHYYYYYYEIIHKVQKYIGKNRHYKNKKYKGPRKTT